jgi:hypothetical protein
VCVCVCVYVQFLKTFGDDILDKLLIFSVAGSGAQSYYNLFIKGHRTLFVVKKLMRPKFWAIYMWEKLSFLDTN